MGNNLKAAMKALNKKVYFIETFTDEIDEILKTYKNGSTEVLDGDEVDELIRHLKNRINLLEGNITEDEFNKLDRNNN